MRARFRLVEPNALGIGRFLFPLAFVGSLAIGCGESSSNGATGGETHSGGSSGGGAATGGFGTGGASGGSASGGGGTGGSGGGASGGTGGSEASLIWPNEESSANSDAWLIEHHDEIDELRPRILLINFDAEHTFEQVTAKTEAVMAAVAEGSRYHAYSDPGAPKFLNYEIVKSVDLRGKAPTKADGTSMDMTKFINGQAFADLVGFADPNGSSNLTLCQLFERGLVNEVWVGESNDQEYIYEIVSQGQTYDEEMKKKVGSFDRCVGNGCMDAVTCGVTIRLATINSGRGPGCGTHAYGHALEGQVQRNQIPYFTKNAERFFNFRLDLRHGTSFDDFYVCPYDYSGNCVEVVSPTHLKNGPKSPYAFDITDWGDGCGNVHFTPHSRYQYDTDPGVTARATCEGYGLGEGVDGKDATTDIDYSVYQDLDEDPAYSDCAGGWQIYWRQSMPGYGNKAKDVDGNPMKNWWPFLFY